MNHSNDLEEGQQYSTHAMLVEGIKRYEDNNHVKLTVQGSKTVADYLKRCPKKCFKLDIVYAQISLTCIHYGQHQSRSTGQRPKTK